MPVLIADNSLRIKLHRFLRSIPLISVFGCVFFIFEQSSANDSAVNEVAIPVFEQRAYKSDSLPDMNDIAQRNADPYFEELSADEFNAFKSKQYSKQGELGFKYCVTDKGDIVVSDIYDADLSRLYGLETGDLILAVNDVDVLDLSNEALEASLNAPPGQIVKLKTHHKGIDDAKTLVLESRRALIKTVTGRVVGEQIGYIRLSSFLPQTPMDLRKQLAHIKKQTGSRLQGWIFDLRDNLGGNLEAAVQSADLIMDDGIIASILDNNGKVKNLYSASPGDAALGLPIILLINSHTASAAELMVAALKDNKRALILGTRSFGKDTIQTTHELQNGGAIKLTTARYLTPSGQSISSLGIQPDIVSSDRGSPLDFIVRLMGLSADKKLKCADQEHEEALMEHDATINKAVNLLKLTPSFFQ